MCITIGCKNWINTEIFCLSNRESTTCSLRCAGNGPDLGESSRYINVFADLCLTNGYPDWQLRVGCRQIRHDSEWPKAVSTRFHGFIGFRRYGVGARFLPLPGLFARPVYGSLPPSADCPQP